MTGVTHGNDKRRNAPRKFLGLTTAIWPALMAAIGVLAFGVQAIWFEPQKKAPTPQKPIQAKHTDLIYRGRVLSCIDFSKMPKVGGRSLDCKFQAFYDHPQQVKPNSKLEHATVIELIDNGKVLYCVHRGNFTVDGWRGRAASCDDVRYEHDPMPN